MSLTDVLCEVETTCFQTGELRFIKLNSRIGCSFWIAAQSLPPSPPKSALQTGWAALDLLGHQQCRSGTRVVIIFKKEVITQRGFFFQVIYEPSYSGALCKDLVTLNKKIEIVLIKDNDNLICQITKALSLSQNHVCCKQPSWITLQVKSSNLSELLYHKSFNFL